MSSTAMLEVKNLTKHFKAGRGQLVHAVDNVSFTLEKGKTLGLVGETGAGKTTTIKILTGQLRPTSGEAEVLGIPCDRIDETIYEQIGIVTDVSGVYERMSVFDNLKYFARILTCLSKRSTLS